MTLRLLRRAALAASFVALASAVTGCAADFDDELTDDVELDVKGGKKKNKGKNKNGEGNGGGGNGGGGNDNKGRRFDVVQHNIGGDAENDGGPAGIAYTLDRVQAINPDAVMLEEVCAAQYEAFKQRFPTWSVLFAPMTMNEGWPKCGGTPKGQLLASPRAMVEEIRQDLGEPDGNKQFTLLCGAIPMPNTARKVLACVTHLRAGDGDNAAIARARKLQAYRISTTLTPRANGGQAVVLGGDLNAGPGRDTLDRIYRLTRSGNYNGGVFDEADQADGNRDKYARRDDVRCADDACRTGEGTMTSNSSKLDYVFFSNNRVSGKLNAEVEGNGGSGHKLYHAWTWLKL